MTKKEKLFCAMLLDMASDEFANHCCNDLTAAMEACFTADEWDQLNREYHELNGDPEEFRKGHILPYDWAWMSFMAGKLRAEILQMP